MISVGSKLNSARKLNGGGSDTSQSIINENELNFFVLLTN